jgi:hypothetical protein
VDLGVEPCDGAHVSNGDTLLRDNPSTVPVWINANIPTVRIGSAGEVLGICSKKPDPVDSRLLSVLRAEFSALA